MRDVIEDALALIGLDAGQRRPVGTEGADARRLRRDPGKPEAAGHLPFWAVDPVLYRETVEVNVAGTFFMSRTVTPRMGEALGQMYVAKYFPPEDKARVQTLVQNLLAAFKQSIDTLDWMGPETKQAAQAKLAI